MRTNQWFRLRPAEDSKGLDLLLCEPLAEANVPHGFTLRWRRCLETGSREVYGARDGEAADRNQLAGALGFESLVHMRQVHGNEVRRLQRLPSDPPECDGILTKQDRIGLMVQTADCLPMLFWHRERNAVAAVHAGWRGTLAGVALQAVSSFQSCFQAQPDSLQVAIGPAIGPCCYEVGDEVVRAFVESGEGSEGLFSSGRRQRKHLNLIEANRKQLTEAGIPEDHIYSADICTLCENELFYSYRKEGKGVGRLYGAIGVLSE